jgi:hypothetical protein
MKHPPLSSMPLYVGITTMSFAALPPTVLGVSLTLPPEIPEGGELKVLWHEDDHIRQERKIVWVREA